MESGLELTKEEAYAKFRFFEKLSPVEPKDTGKLVIKKFEKNTWIRASFTYFSIEFLNAIKDWKITEPFFFEDPIQQGGLGLIPKNERLNVYIIYTFYHTNHEKNLDDARLVFSIENQEEFCKKMVKLIIDVVESQEYKKLSEKEIAEGYTKEYFVEAKKELFKLIKKYKKEPKE